MAKVPTTTCPDSYPRHNTVSGIDISRESTRANKQLWPEVRQDHSEWRDSETGRRVPKPDWADE